MRCARVQNESAPSAVDILMKLKFKGVNLPNLAGH
jgi:hypothetical protein